MAMPYGIKFLPPLLSLTFLIWFIAFWVNKAYLHTDFKLYTNYLLPAFAIICLLSLTYSANWVNGIKMLERLISFVVFPFIFFTYRRRLKMDENQLFLLLGFSLMVSFAVLFIQFNLAVETTKLSELSLGDFFRYTRYYILIHSLALHPSYYSFLVLIFIAYYLSVAEKKIAFKSVHSAFAFLSLLLLLVLQSRGALVTLIFLGIYLLMKLFYLKKYYLLSVGLIILLSSTVWILNNTRMKETVRSVFSSEQSETTDSRIIIWNNALHTIKEKPIAGHGIGDALDELIKEHEKTGYASGVEKRLDAHNQFLETWLQSGIIGLISLLLVFIFPVYHAIKKKQELLFLFLLVAFTQLLFESMFVRLAGVVYFSFFYSFLYYYKSPGYRQVNLD
jgi:O-antigen ligase